MSNPFGVEGCKTIAYEIVMQLSGRVPDRIYVPLASGDGLYGIWKGMNELRTLQVIGRLPRMYGCQAEGCNPFVRAFQANRREVGAVSEPTTVALSIREATGGSYALDAIYASKGAALDVSDSDILRAAKLLASGGVAAEAASAAAVACALRAAKTGDIGPREVVVCIITGPSVKWPDTLDLLGDEPLVNDPTFEELKLTLWL